MSDTSENGLSGQALGFMRQAIELSEENVRSGGGPFGAVIVRDGRVIATGTNGVTRLNDPTAHAEVTAIRNAARALVRAVPDVPRGDLLGPDRKNVLRE